MARTTIPNKLPETSILGQDPDLELVLGLDTELELELGLDTGLELEMGPGTGLELELVLDTELELAVDVAIETFDDEADLDDKLDLELDTERESAVDVCFDSIDEEVARKLVWTGVLATLELWAGIGDTGLMLTTKEQSIILKRQDEPAGQ